MSEEKQVVVESSPQPEIKPRSEFRPEGRGRRFMGGPGRRRRSDSGDGDGKDPEDKLTGGHG